MKTLVACLLLTAFALAGCAGSQTPDDQKADELAEGAPEIEVTETTGGIRGVVVDDAIRPIKGATVEVVGTDKKMTTDDTGLFSFSGLEAGPYFVKASHPLYDLQQQSVDVKAGVADPDPVKILLTRVVLQDPYLQTIKYDGFIVCSINLVVLLSEECGEGVGVPCDAGGVPIPVIGCQRVGGQGNNNVQFDFTIGAGAKTMIVEKVWEPTSDAGTALYSPIATEWSCLPVCAGNQMASMDGESPLYAAIDNATLEGNEIIPDETLISVFTWASPSFTGAVLNQKYSDFITVFYHVPAPEGWSFVQGSPNPFV
ncbi:MAG: carboxypeptidase-like regulatory domain-containing protein [Thermoplasmatota archaeon]